MITFSLFGKLLWLHHTLRHTSGNPPKQRMGTVYLRDLAIYQAYRGQGTQILSDFVSLTKGMLS